MKKLLKKALATIFLLIILLQIVIPTVVYAGTVSAVRNTGSVSIVQGTRN